MGLTLRLSSARPGASAQAASVGDSKPDGGGDPGRYRKPASGREPRTA